MSITSGKIANQQMNQKTSHWHNENWNFSTLANKKTTKAKRQTKCEKGKKEEEPGEEKEVKGCGVWIHREQNGWNCDKRKQKLEGDGVWSSSSYC